MKRPNVKKTIREAQKGLAEVMKLNLRAIMLSMVDQIIAKAKSLQPAQRINAIKDIKPKGILGYRDAVLQPLAIMADEAIRTARKEIPGAKSIKLAELGEETIQLGPTVIFEKLPPSVRKKLLAQSTLLIDTQIKDLEKTLYFQYTNSFETTEDFSLMRQDLKDAGEEFVSGATVQSGAGVTSAKIINEARSAFFFDEEVLEEIEAFEFVNEDPVTPICNDLAGTVFAKDDPEMFRYTPPLHWNCKSWIRPILKGNLGNRSIEKLKPSTKKVESSIQFSESSCGCSLEDWTHAFVADLNDESPVLEPFSK